VLITTDYVKKIADKAGFDLVGFSKYRLLDKEVDYLANWIKKEYNGGMKYLENNLEKRKDIRKILEGCNSVISFGLNYYAGEKYFYQKDKYKISRYAWGKDYHLVMWDKLSKIIDEIKKDYIDLNAVYYVDTGPVMDKVWAVNSGLGWMGKNTNIINRNFGSWFFIGNILCNAEFDRYSEKVNDFCGSCTKCVDSCPTNALLGNYEIDASRCISYLNIENKGDIPDDFAGKFDNWLLGCDICQEVCPWNIKFAKTTKEINFIEGKNVEFSENDFNLLTPAEFNKKFKESPILRPKLKGIIRTIEFIKKV
jgi:epoxyqueuosine reductase